jgi:hypothetical protein
MEGYDAEAWRKSEMQLGDSPLHQLLQAGSKVDKLVRN